MERAEAALDDDFVSGLDEDARRAVETTIDLDRDENQCPACARPFTGFPERCPGCHLRFR